MNSDDPLLAEWQRLHALQAIDLRVMENVGMEATAALIWTWANELLKERDSGRTCCFAVEARENSSNAATYAEVPPWFSAQS